MKVKKSPTEAIKELLKDRDEVYNSMLNNTFDFDDEELKRINKVKELERWEFDILYLSSKMSVKEVAELYTCSTTHVYNILNSIQKKLKEC